MKPNLLLLLIPFATLSSISSFNINPTKSDLIITSDPLQRNNYFQPKSRSIRHVKEDEENEFIADIKIARIYSMQIESNITNRYAQTLVISKVRNDADIARETIFAVILPEKAFISKFIMAINGRNYTAYVKEKEEAKQIYKNAIKQGQGAAHLVASARDSNRFTVSVNIEPLSKATFYLTYEQLLARKNHMYELVINIHPGQPVKDLTVNVEIKESLPLSMVRVAPIRSGNNIIESEEDLDPRAKIERIDGTCAKINFKPDVLRQKELAKLMKFPEEEGLSGQFIIQYDVERSQNGGEVLLEDGYFIHFFAPTKMETLSKNVIFVLDTSGSMVGTKLDQLKTAMKKILNELKPADKFSIIEFNTDVRLLTLDNLFPSNDVTQTNIQQAETIISSLWAIGLTNIYDALIFALNKVNQLEGNSNLPQPIIIFLTDGDATVGITDHSTIVEDITKANKYKTPIYCLSFGADAKKDLLQKLSLKNNGFSRHIYEGTDAAIQLQDFYKYVSSPIMNNITFKYVSDAKEVTKTSFPIMYDGSEIVVTGKIGNDNNFQTLPKITAQCAKGPIDLVPEIKKPIAKLERLWAYVTIQQLLQEKEISKNNMDEIKSKALDIALKYNFVTPVSSLVVVKPNSTDSVDLEGAERHTNVPEGKVISANFFRIGADHIRSYPDHYSYPVKSSLISSSGDYGPSRRLIAAPSVDNYRRLSSYGSARSANSYHNQAGFLNAMSIQRPTSRHLDLTFTTTTRHPNEEIVNINQLKQKLPWINNVLKGDVLETDKGTYKIDLNKLSPKGVTCPVTPTNAANGYCKFIHECPEMLPFLINVKIFEIYQCDLDGYAAICCPPK